MKFKNFFFAALALVSLAACSNEDDPQATNSENVNAYMQLSITGVKEGQSRADSFGTDESNPLESKITNLTIFLCSKANGTVQKTYTLKNVPLHKVNTSSGDALATEPFEVATGDYYVYVMANKPESFSPTGDLKTEIIASITEELMKSTYAKDNSFVMFNESKNLTFTPYEVSISPSNDYLNPATLAKPVKLDRLAVKIQSKLSESSLNIQGLNDTKGTLNNQFSKVELVGFKLLNGASKVNLLQKWVFETTGVSYGQYLNTLITPSALTSPYSDYYNKLDQVATITKDVGGYTEAQNNYHVIPQYGSSGTSPIFCMENNSGYDNASTKKGILAKQGNTTGIIYKMKVTLKDISGKGGSESEASLGHDTFYWYNGKYYATLAAIEAANTTIFTDKSTTLSAVITELGDILKMPVDSEVNITAREKALSDFRIKYMIKVFDNGYMYYTHYIVDKNYNQLKDKENLNEGEKTDKLPSVLRNNIYDLTVTKLLRIGNDIPGGWNPETDPDKPVNPTNVYMQVEVQVNPWTLQGQDVELK